MRDKEFLEALRSYPLHAAMVHVPIGLFISGFLLDLAGWESTGSQALIHASMYAKAFGIVTALIAAMFGSLDWSRIRHDDPSKRLGLAHMLLNIVAVCVFAASVFLHYRGLPASHVPGMAALLSGIGVALIGISGYIGGEMVYNMGTHVGWYRRRAPLPTETACLSVADADGGLAYAPGAETLKPGESMRIEAGKTIIAVMNSDGNIYAVQEFCTHRFGPLSEGAVADGTVECPWHRSRFDLTSGKAVEGPAKTGLRVFDVVIRNGKIFVRVSRSGTDAATKDS